MFNPWCWRRGVLQKVFRRNQQNTSNIFWDGNGWSGQLRVEQFLQVPSSLSCGMHEPSILAKSATVITRSQMRTLFASLSRPGVAPTHLLLASSQNCPMIDVSFLRWISGTHWFFITTQLPRSPNRSRMWESQPCSRWRVVREASYMSGVTNTDCS